MAEARQEHIASVLSRVADWTSETVSAFYSAPNFEPRKKAAYKKKLFPKIMAARGTLLDSLKETYEASEPKSDDVQAALVTYMRSIQAAVNTYTTLSFTGNVDLKWLFPQSDEIESHQAFNIIPFELKNEGTSYKVELRSHDRIERPTSKEIADTINKVIKKKGLNDEVSLSQCESTGSGVSLKFQPAGGRELKPATIVELAAIACLPNAKTLLKNAKSKAKDAGASDNMLASFISERSFVVEPESPRVKSPVPEIEDPTAEELAAVKEQQADFIESCSDAKALAAFESKIVEELPDFKAEVEAHQKALQAEVEAKISKVTTEIKKKYEEQTVEVRAISEVPDEKDYAAAIEELQEKNGELAAEIKAVVEKRNQLQAECETLSAYITENLIFILNQVRVEGHSDHSLANDALEAITALQDSVRQHESEKELEYKGEIKENTRKIDRAQYAIEYQAKIDAAHAAFVKVQPTLVAEFKVLIKAAYDEFSELYDTCFDNYKREAGEARKKLEMRQGEALEKFLQTIAMAEKVYESIKTTVNVGLEVLASALSDIEAEEIECKQELDELAQKTTRARARVEPSLRNWEQEINEKKTATLKKKGVQEEKQAKAEADYGNTVVQAKAEYKNAIQASSEEYKTTLQQHIADHIMLPLKTAQGAFQEKGDAAKGRFDEALTEAQDVFSEGIQAPEKELQFAEADAEELPVEDGAGSDDVSEESWECEEGETPISDALIKAGVVTGSASAGLHAASENSKGVDAGPSIASIS